MIYAGIDPGLDGAIAIFDPQMQRIEVTDMPTFTVRSGKRDRREIDEARLADLLEAQRPDHVLVEKVWAQPGEAQRASFRFGVSYGIVRGVVAALSLRATYIPPATWKRKLGVPAGKDAARQRASELLPRHAYLWPLKKHDGRAEASLLACYAELTASPEHAARMVA